MLWIEDKEYEWNGMKLIVYDSIIGEKEKYSMRFCSN